MVESNGYEEYEHHEREDPEDRWSPDDAQWELTGEFGNLFADDDVTGRTFSGIETRLRSASLTSTITGLLGVGIATLGELLGTPSRRHAENEGRP